MLKKFTLGLLTVLTVAFLVSCGGENADRAEASANITAPQTPDATTPAATPAAQPAQPAAPVGPTTVMSFTETEFDFGKVDAGEKVEHVYKFTNTGNEPLIISNAKGSCGCTVPDWPREPIAVGGTGEIKVVFDSKNKKGQRNQKVTITANTDPPQTFIYMKGEVIPAEGDAANTAAPQIKVNQ